MWAPEGVVTGSGTLRSPGHMLTCNPREGGKTQVSLNRHMYPDVCHQSPPHMASQKEILVLK